MSIESANAFKKRMNEDEEFRNRIMSIEDTEARWAAIVAEGYEFTQSEFNGGELNDDDLDGVAGGGGSSCSYTMPAGVVISPAAGEGSLQVARTVTGVDFTPVPGEGSLEID